MKSPEVSVIIPAYNAAAFINRCVDSVLAQTYKDYEIIIVDDGSIDDTPTIVDDIAAKNAAVRAIHQDNMGLAEARHSGIKASRGNYIVHVDADDWLIDNAIELLYNRCLEENLDYCAGIPLVYFSQTNISSSLRPNAGIFSGSEFLKLVLSPKGNLPSWACITKRELWQDDVFPPMPMRLPNEDLPLNVGLSKYIKRAGVFNDMIVCYYYLNPQSLTCLGVLYQQSRWRSFFSFIRGQLELRGIAEECENSLRILEIDRLAFHVKNIDENDEWIKQIYSYNVSSFPLKYRILHVLIKYPRICQRLIKLYQMLKSALVSDSRKPYKKNGNKL
jgi:glycosyltransferase involved in cell wall biosynthesis